MIIENLKFEVTSPGCPEQYDVFKNNKQIAYIRLRWGHLIVEHPDVNGELIYEHCFDSDEKGGFDGEDERSMFLELIANKINRRLHE